MSHVGGAAAGHRIDGLVATEEAEVAVIDHARTFGNRAIADQCERAGIDRGGSGIAV